jgi:hypothetical protein
LSTCLAVIVPPPAALAAQGVEFQAPAQLQRGGLLLLDGVAYAGYGGNSGDCQECEFPSDCFQPLPSQWDA